MSAWSRCHPDNFRRKSISISLKLRISCRIENLSRVWKKNESFNFKKMWILLLFLLQHLIFLSDAVTFRNMVAESMGKKHLKWFCMMFFFLTRLNFVFFAFVSSTWVMLFEQSASELPCQIIQSSPCRWRRKKKDFQQIENELKWTWNANEPFATDYDPILLSIQHVWNDLSTFHWSFYSHNQNHIDCIVCMIQCQLAPKRFASCRSIDCSVLYFFFHSNRIWFWSTWNGHDYNSEWTEKKRKEITFPASKHIVTSTQSRSEFLPPNPICLHRRKSIKNVK